MHYNNVKNTCRAEFWFRHVWNIVSMYYEEGRFSISLRFLFLQISISAYRMRLITSDVKGKAISLSIGWKSLSFSRS